MSQEERREIEILRRRGYSLREIARTLGRAPSGISYELNEKKVWGEYIATKAQQKSYVRRKYAKYQGKKIVHHPELRAEIDWRLLDDQSPRAISRRIRRWERHLPSISKNAIYRYITSVYGRNIETHRLWKKRRGGRRRGSTKKLSQRTFIDKRPKYINDRGRIGDVEGDFILSGRSGHGILLAVADRKSRVSFIEQILKVTIPDVHQAFLRIKRRFPEMKTMTTDNDLLFEHHKELGDLLSIRIYFCHPYHSYEKGSIENTNGVIRRDVLKGSDISKYSKRFIGNLEHKLNRRPMEVLGDRTPREVLDGYRSRIGGNKKHP